MNGMLGPAFLFGTGLDEWAVLGAICFLLFGPKRLPEIARTIGRTLEKLRRAADDFREQISHLDDPLQRPLPQLPSPPMLPTASDNTSAGGTTSSSTPVAPPAQADTRPPAG